MCLGDAVPLCMNYTITAGRTKHLSHQYPNHQVRKITHTLIPLSGSLNILLRYSRPTREYWVSLWVRVSTGEQYPGFLGLTPTNIYLYKAGTGKTEIFLPGPPNAPYPSGECSPEL